MRLLIGAAVIALAAGRAFACSAISDDAERLACYDQRYSQVELIRCRSLLENAVCEVLSPGTRDRLSCVAFNADNEVLARARGLADSGVLFDGIAADDIVHLDCEATGR